MTHVAVIFTCKQTWRAKRQLHNASLNRHASVKLPSKTNHITFTFLTTNKMKITIIILETPVFYALHSFCRNLFNEPEETTAWSTSLSIPLLLLHVTDCKGPKQSYCKLCTSVMVFMLMATFSSIPNFLSAQNPNTSVHKLELQRRLNITVNALEQYYTDVWRSLWKDIKVNVTETAK